MATIPTGRSYSSILGSMLDSLLSRLGLPSLVVGNPVLSILEAAAQSDFRANQDIFNLLNSNSLDRAEGMSLDRIGADEGLARIGESASTGVVTVTDTSFTKKETQIFRGLPPPPIGAATLSVVDASSFPASGSVYVGRGTTAAEGPLAYASKTDNGDYWTLTLSAYTERYHNHAETVTLAQGGDRVIPAGSIVQTALSGAGVRQQFSTLFASTLFDGETSLAGVQVRCTAAGIQGNVAAGSIRDFASAPFTGAAATNPTPFSNGTGVEADEDFRDRIRNVRQSRSRGTALAITTGVNGAVSLSENKKILSSSVVVREGQPTTLYIDDGAGYEESSQGIPYEVIVDQAQGGEQDCQLTYGRPVTKASVKTALVAPFAVTDAMRLSVKVAGVTYGHDFSASDFRASGAATAYEVAASINANPSLGFRARTADGGTTVVLTATADSRESLEVVESVGYTDANAVLGFGTDVYDTLRLYLNDEPLSKDGAPAFVTGNAGGSWGALSSGETLIIRIDGVDVALTAGTNTYTITDADFVASGSGYSLVSEGNSKESWATVLNYKIPGITATVANGALVLTSNRGLSASASVEILGGTLVTKGVFEIGSSFGEDSDYILDRNLGQIHLTTPLTAGDKLTAGTSMTRAFLESSEFVTHIISAESTTVVGDTGAELWFVVGNPTTPLPLATAVGIELAVTVTPAAWGERVRYAHASQAIFAGVDTGDWIIIQDTAFNVANIGYWRIADADPAGLWFEVERPAGIAVAEASVILAEGRISAVRTAAIPQRLYLAAGSDYTAQSLVDAMDGQVLGASVSTYDTTRIRISDVSYGENSTISLIAANGEGLALGFPLAVATGVKSHLGTVTSGNSGVGTPYFGQSLVSAAASETSVTMVALGDIASGRPIVVTKPIPDGGERYGRATFNSMLEVISGTTLTLRTPVSDKLLVGAKLYSAAHYGLSYEDDLGLTLDEDENSRRFVVPMYRRVKPTTSTYGITNTFTETDSTSLSTVFGNKMAWEDFAVFMPARTKSHVIAGVDTTQTMLWRYYRLGSEGNGVKVQYNYPTTASAAVALSTSTANEGLEVGVKLASGAARTGATVDASTKIGYARISSPGAGLTTHTYVVGLAISSGQRVVRLNYVAGSGVRTGNVTGSISGPVGTGATDFGTYITFTPSAPVISGETLTFGGGGTATASGTQYGVSELTLNVGAVGVMNHGLTVGTTVNMNFNGTGTTAGFVSGTKTIYEVTASTISYLEGSTPIAPVASIGSVTNGLYPASLSAPIVVGDIATISSDSGVPDAYRHTVKITTLDAQHWRGVALDSGATSATLAWAPLNAASNVSFYPLATNSITSIASSVNALTDSPLKAVAVGDGLGGYGNITEATFETTSLGGANPWYSLVDGLNYIRSTSTVPPYHTITFKEPISTSYNLTVNSDWANEDIRLVPVSAKNIKDFLNSGASVGLIGNGAVVETADHRVQITTNTVGTAGAVQVQGGTANNLSVPISGTAEALSTKMLVTVSTPDAKGLTADMWVSVVNSVAMPKAVIDAATNLDSITATGTVTLDAGGTAAWSVTSIPSRTYQFTRQGRFTVCSYVSGGAPSYAALNEGDWVHIHGGTANSLNTGTFRVVRVDDTNKLFWFENPNHVDEAATALLDFYPHDSIMPGDTITINTSTWGVGNLGTWTVLGNDGASYGGGGNTHRFYLDTTTKTCEVVIAPGPGALGAAVNLVQVREGSPSTYYKRVSTISPSATSGYTDVQLLSEKGASYISEAAGSVMHALDKLDFSTGVNRGTDAYGHSLGLIEEANKIVYGLESAPSTYPGLAAAGTTINIEGPAIRRIQVSLGIRATTNSAELRATIQSVVASAINSLAVGESVAISDLVAAASTVSGVQAVSVISPTYGISNDRIRVQPHEKPLVLDLAADVLVTFVGE